jgi:hypothetical protein
MFDYYDHTYYLMDGRGYRVLRGRESEATEIYQVNVTAAPSSQNVLFDRKKPTRVWVLQGPTEKACQRLEALGDDLRIIFDTGSLDGTGIRWTELIRRPIASRRNVLGALTRTRTWTFEYVDHPGGIMLTFTNGFLDKARLL